VIFKNEIGGDGLRAYSSIYTSRPDGYTVGTFDIAFAIESLRSQLDFDINRFTYLLRLNTATRILVTRKDGFTSWNEMLKSAHAKELKWGVGVLWRTTHADSIIVKEEIGIPARFIPFGNTAMTINALIRGDIQVALVSADSVKALTDAGEIRVLTEFSDKRSYPGVPNILDLGYPHIIEKLGVHRFLIAPPAVPVNIKNSLITAFKKAINDKGFQSWAQKNGFVMNPLYGDEAEMLAKKMIKFLQVEMKPIFKKYED
jgi:tripartite-type tricarboxylate transporter receptor subunit TctC